jgi:aquaporin Z
LEDKVFNSKVFLAEFIGTFALVFIGAGAGISGAGLVAVALAHGFTLAVFAYAYGHISGTHVNPAVTFGLALNGTIKWGEAFVYWVAQFLGAILAGFVLKMAVGDISAGATVGSLSNSAPIMGMIIEAILTFFLVNTILHTAVAGKGGPFAGWAIGTTLAFAILAGGPLTGASLNPARTVGVAVFSQPNFLTSVNPWVIYILGPLIGSTFAVMVYNFFNGEMDAPEPAPAKKPAPRKVAKK